MAPDPGAEPTPAAKKKKDVAVRAIKTSLRSICLTPDYLSALREYAEKVSETTMHAFAVARLFFVKSLEKNPKFDIAPLVNSNFFATVFCALTTMEAKAGPTTKRGIWRAMIAETVAEYMQVYGIEAIPFHSAGQTSGFEGTAMQTAYIVGIKRQFGNQLRRLINHLAGVKDKAKQIRSEMGKRPNREVRRELEERLWRPVCLLKEQVARRRPDPAQVHEDWRWILGVLAPIHKAYDDDYKFNNDPSKATIYYSAVAEPRKHLRAFWQLARIQEQRGLRPVQVFPTRSKCTPRHTIIDRAVLCGNILRKVGASLNDPPLEIWGRLFNTNNRIFKKRRGFEFNGTISTNGTSVTVLKKRLSEPTPAEVLRSATAQAPAARHSGVVLAAGRPGEVPVPVTALRGGADPLWSGEAAPTGHYGHAAAAGGAEEQPPTLSDFTQRAAAVGKGHDDEDQYIHNLDPAEIKRLLPRMVFADPGRRDIIFCMGYQSTKEEPKLLRFTANERRVAQRMRRYAKIRDRAKLAAPDNAVARAEAQLSAHARLGADGTDHSNYQSCRATGSDAYMRHLAVHAQVWPVLREHYYNTPTKDLGSGTQPLHRKLELSSYIKQQQADRRLVRRLRATFGDDLVLILGDWAAPNNKFHEPIRGIGFRRMLRHHGIEVYLLREAYTSTYCPFCIDGRLETFKKGLNPRPWQRKNRKTVTVHGLLRCQTDKCLNPDGQRPKARLLNRDLAAVLNYRHIVNSLAEGNGIPERFLGRKPTDGNNNTDGGSGSNTGTAAKRARTRAPRRQRADKGSSASAPAPRKRQPRRQPAAPAPKHPCISGSSVPASTPLLRTDGSSSSHGSSANNNNNNNNTIQDFRGGARGNAAPKMGR